VYDNCNTATNNWTNLEGSYVNDTGIDGTLVFTGNKELQNKECPEYLADAKKMR
jgi:hypothetical protein